MAIVFLELTMKRVVLILSERGCARVETLMSACLKQIDRRIHYPTTLKIIPQGVYRCLILLSFGLLEYPRRLRSC